MASTDIGEPGELSINDLLSGYGGSEPTALYENDPDAHIENADIQSVGKQPKQKRVRTRGTSTHDKQFFRRFTSERQLEETLDWEFEQGAAYHVISGGDVDSLTFLKLILRQQPVRYLALSTWCMALQDIEEIDRYIELGRIKRLDSYVGEIFKGSYNNEYRKLCDLHVRRGGRVAIFRNHAKVCCGFGERFDFVIESSANINTNPRTENTVITIHPDLARFYKDFFDGIKSFERNFDDWEPYSIDEQSKQERRGTWY